MGIGRAGPRIGWTGLDKKEAAEAASHRFRALVLHRTDFPDHASAGDLDERAIGGADKMRVGAVVPHHAVIDDIGASVWAEPDIRRAVEPVDHGYERLVVSAVA